MSRCEQCGMPDERHLSDCPVRLARRAQPRNPKAADLARWMNDPDVKLIVHATLRRYSVDSISELASEVIDDLHEAIKTMLEESPTITTLGDPRRMV